MISFPLPILSFQKYLFFLEITSSTLLPPYKGSALHGGIIGAFKKAVCVMSHGQCDKCPLPENCSYYSLFEYHQAPSGRSVPHAYVLQPPFITRRAFDVGDELSFSMILIGKATSLWKLLIFAVKLLGETSGIGRRIDGKRGKYTLMNVDSIGLNGRSTRVYSSKDDFLQDTPITITSDDFAALQNEPFTKLTLDPDTEHSEGEEEGFEGRPSAGNNSSTDSASLQFLTPVRFIKEEFERKQLLNSLNFESFMRELIRRLGDLSEAYCGGSRIPSHSILQQAAIIRTDNSGLRWQDWERYSHSQKFRMKLGGLVGTLLLSGYIEPFVPYLRLGQWLHVGKNTTFGLGQYQLVLSSSEEI